MKIGIIGAGRMAQAVGTLALKAGYKVMLSNSRGPASLQPLHAAYGFEVGTVEDTAIFGDIVFAAIHLQNFKALPAEHLIGKVILNPQNYFPHFGCISQLELNELTTAELLAQHLPQSYIVKALNSILVEDIVSDARPNGATDRRAIPIAGDDDAAIQAAIQFLDRLGYDALNAGALAEGWRFERRRPVYCVPLNKAMLSEMLAKTTLDNFMPEGHWRSYPKLVG